MKNNRLLTALRYVGDPSRDGAAQYLIATASAQEVTQAYDVFVTTLEESYDGQPIHRFLSELCHARVELQSLQQTDFFKVKKKMKRGASASTRHSSLSRTISVSPIPYRFSVRRETAKLHSDRGTCAGQAVTTTWWSWLSPCRNRVS